MIHLFTHVLRQLSQTCLESQNALRIVSPILTFEILRAGLIVTFDCLEGNTTITTTRPLLP